MIGFDAAAYRRGFWRGLVAGLVAGLTVAMCARPASATEPADRTVVAVASGGDGSRVLLYAQAGPCIRGALLAEHVTREGEVTPGCWIVMRAVVLVSFLDGERGNIPVSALKRPADA